MFLVFGVLVCKPKFSVKLWTQDLPAIYVYENTLNRFYLFMKYIPEQYRKYLTCVKEHNVVEHSLYFPTAVTYHGYLTLYPFFFTSLHFY